MKSKAAVTARLLPLAALVCSFAGGPVAAQEAAAAGGPLHQAGGTSDVYNMVTAPPPQTRPTRPFDIWEWQFFRQERTLAGQTVDTIAFQVRIDCQAGTRRRLAAESYLDGEPVRRVVMSDPAETSAPGTLGATTIRAVCEPGFGANRVVYPDHRIARQRVDEFFAANP